MLTRPLMAFLCLGVLVSCGGDSGGGDGETVLRDDVTCVSDNPLQDCEEPEEPDEEPTDPDEIPDTAQGVPAELAENLVSFAFSGSGDRLTVEITGIDTTPVEAVYERQPALDQPGYVAYSVQEDALDRFFVAIGNVTADGSASAVAVGSGGLFERTQQGSGYERTGAYTPPTVGEGPGAGQVTYAGSYAGVSNIMSVNGDQLIDSTGAADATRPSQPGMVTGTILLNANFADNLVEGVIHDRVVTNPNSNAAADGERVTVDLLDANLELTEIDDTGEFLGNVFTVDENDVETNIGDYGGIFAGTNAAYVAGSVRIEIISDDYEEVGVFVLTQCGQPGDDDTVCPLVQPDF